MGRQCCRHGHEVDHGAASQNFAGSGAAQLSVCRRMPSRTSWFMWTASNVTTLTARDLALRDAAAVGVSRLSDLNCATGRVGMRRDGARLRCGVVALVAVVVAAGCSSSGSSTASGFADSLHAVCRAAATASIDLDTSKPRSYLTDAVRIVRGEINGTADLNAPASQRTSFSDFSSNLDDQLRAFRKASSAVSTGDSNSVRTEVTRLSKVIASGSELAKTLDASRCESIFDLDDIASLAVRMAAPPRVPVGGVTTTTTGPRESPPPSPVRVVQSCPQSRGVPVRVKMRHGNAAR